MLKCQMLCLLQVLDVTQFMKYAVQSAAMFESRFNSVERILAYAKLKPEAPHHILGKQTPPDWPQAGVISYKNVVMKYRPELEPVLKVSCWQNWVWSTGLSTLAL